MSDDKHAGERRTNAYLAGVVELGMCYKTTLGVRVAMIYFRECGVPREVADRVIGAAPCRKTEHAFATDT